MSLAGNLPTSISELAKLSDEIWYLAGDTSVDTAWYTKRASLSAVYATTGKHPSKSPFTLGSQRMFSCLHMEQLICPLLASFAFATRYTRGLAG